MESLSNRKAKIGFFSANALCIGTIIGAGIFGSLPAASVMVGSGIALCFVVAYLEIIIRTLPAIIPSSAIPSSSGFYMHLSRLVHPVAGFMQVIKIMLTIFILTLLATLFGTYLNLLIPVNLTVASVTIIILFCVIGYFGLEAGAKVQNMMVSILLVALSIFVVLGLVKINPEYLSLKGIIFPTGITLTGFGAALGMLTSALGGSAEVLMSIADDLENPKTNITKYFISSTGIVVVFYILMGLVVVGSGPLDASSSLGNIAEKFMPTYLYLFFIVGGAIFAITTTINGLLLSTVAAMDLIAKDKVLPEIFEKKNKYGQNTYCLVLVGFICIFVLLFKFSIMALMSVASFLTIVVAVVQFLPVIKLPKRYPNCYKHSTINFPQWSIYLMIFISFCFCLFEAYSLVVSSTTGLWYAILITGIVCFCYFLLRKSYLKRKGYDLFAIMSEPYEPWEEMERKYAAGEYDDATK